MLMSMYFHEIDMLDLVEVSDCLCYIFSCFYFNVNRIAHCKISPDDVAEFARIQTELL